ncbi:ankyrin [Paramyrothecium foliicola]|nr:ankyrin [Paramyrothecium foliicola]
MPAFWQQTQLRNNNHQEPNIAMSQSRRHQHAPHSLYDVTRALRNLNLPHYPLEELAREETLGEGETYMVEKCIAKDDAIFAVKHLKTHSKTNDKAFRQRLRSVLLEVQIMRHAPLREHPNIVSVFGYGWDTREGLVIPYILVEYSPLGTMREYLASLKPPPIPSKHLEILFGDIVAGISGLHACGIVHGDLKLDNVLMFPSRNRFPEVIAKLADFGHALVLNDKSDGAEDRPLTYRGTLIYNPPEAAAQDQHPIDREELAKCDFWAFGMLMWEACMSGREYLTCLSKDNLNVPATADDSSRDAIDFIRLARASVVGPSLGPAMFIRMSLFAMLQKDPSKRRGAYVNPNQIDRDIHRVHASLALHLDSSLPTYDMFRMDNRDLIWIHQQQILQGISNVFTDKLDNVGSARINWQIALCYHNGFGTSRDHEKAHEYATLAKSRGHPVAKAFGQLLAPQNLWTFTKAGSSYASQIYRLLRLDSRFTEGMPLLLKACFHESPSKILALLSSGTCPTLSSLDGSNIFHWLFVLECHQSLNQVLDMVDRSFVHRAVNQPLCSVREVHSQWPLQFIGSPLAVAISVNSLPSVKALLDLGADPCSKVYHETSFKPQDPRLEWTAFHIAVKYHCSEILHHLVERTAREKLQEMSPLGCALPFSTSLERLAMHGTSCSHQLELTIDTISKCQSLWTASKTGISPLMQAIDFEDVEVVRSLLQVEPSLAKLPFESPAEDGVFNLPIHFAVQIASRRDTIETLFIPQLIDSHAKVFSSMNSPAILMDSAGRTPLHLSVSGISDHITRWILEKQNSLLHVKDKYGRTPLHHCSSVSNCLLLLNKGAKINQVDRFGTTPLHKASESGSTDLVRCLLNWQRKPRLDLISYPYGTPLHCGVVSGSVSTVTTLLEAGAPVKITDTMGNTALHVTARLERCSILCILLQWGADVKICNQKGKTAEDIAFEYGKKQALNILRRASEPPDYDTTAAAGVDGPRRNTRKHNQGDRYFDRTDFIWDRKPFSASATTEKGYSSQLLDEYEQEPSVGTLEWANRVERLTDEIGSEYFSNYRGKYCAVTTRPDIRRLVSCYAQDVLWDPDHIDQLTEIWARTVYEILYLMEQPGISQHLSSPHLYSPQKSIECIKGNHPEGSADLPDNEERRPPPKVSQSLEELLREDTTTKAGDCPSQHGTCTTQTEPVQQEAVPNIEVTGGDQNLMAAISRVADVVVGTKRKNQFLSRDVADVREMIEWEILRLSCSRVKDQKCFGDSLLKHFPQLEKGFRRTMGYAERAVERRWKSGWVDYTPMPRTPSSDLWQSKGKRKVTPTEWSHFENLAERVKRKLGRTNV